MLSQNRHRPVSSFPLEAIKDEVSFAGSCLIGRALPDDQARRQVQARRAHEGATRHVLDTSHGLEQRSH